MSQINNYYEKGKESATFAEHYKSIIYQQLPMNNNVYLASKPRYEVLDGLRGVASIMVIFFISLRLMPVNSDFRLSTMATLQ